MSFLDLDPRHEANLDEQARLNPLDVSQLGAGAFSGVWTAPFKGVTRGLIAEPARALNLALSAVPRAIDAARGGTDAQDWWFERMVGRRSGPGRLAEAVSPDPHTTGLVGQILQSFFDVGGQALTVGPFGTAVLKGTERATELVEKGMDAGTAMKAGAAEGAGLGVGVYLPMSIGLKSLGNAFYGAAASVLPNMAQRGAVHEILARNGYRDMAEQYQWLDLQQIVIDTVLGVAFGGLGTFLEHRSAAATKVLADRGDAKGAARESADLQGERTIARELGDQVRSADVDAALTGNAARHLEVDAAPGVPRDFAAREAHVAAVMKATEDLLQGRRVDVGETRVDAAEFVRDPHRAEVEAELRQVLKPYDEIAARAANEDTNAVEPVALRGEPDPVRAESEPVRPAEPLAGEARAEAPEVQRAAEIAQVRPDLEIRLDDGTTIKAGEALARADEVIADRKARSRAFDAAVTCFLGG